MLENFVERIKQYPAKEQVELKVRVKVPGSWFPGNLTAEEKRQKYEAQATDWAQAKAFKKVGSRPAQTVCGGQVPLRVRRRRRARARGLLDAADRLEPLQARHVQGGQGR